MKKLLFILLIVVCAKTNGQSFAINTDGSVANTSSILDVKSSNKGILIPRVTSAQRNAIATPAKGLLVYDSTFKDFWFYDGIVWHQVFTDSNSYWKKNGNDIYKANTGNVGIGDMTPNALLHVNGGAVLFDNTIGSTPVSGAGTRLMWVPAKGAFRAGTVSNTSWDDVNIGTNSVALGNGGFASGTYALALGQSSTANATNTVGIGQFAAATNTNAIAIGNTVSAANINSIVLGTSSTSNGRYSIAAGYQLWSKSYGGFVAGLYNDATAAADANAINPLNRIFQVGNGTSSGATSNALTILHNGNTGIGVLNPQHNLSVAKDIRVDDNDDNDGDTANTLRFGAYYTGEAIGSKRTAGGNHWGLDFYTNYNNRMVITYGGNVGIGVYSPSALLTVASDIRLDDNNANNGTTANTLHFGSSSTAEAIGSKRTAGGNQFGLDFYTNGLNRLSVGHNGNVGVGVTTPGSLLTVATDIRLDDNNANNGSTANSLRFGSASSAEAIASKRTATGNQYGLDFYTGGNNRMAISNAGNVGIGTTAPSNKLDVAGRTQTDELQVSANGSVISNIQAGSVTAGSSFSDNKTVVVNFPAAFTVAPKVYFTCRNNGAGIGDTFAVTVRALTTTSVTINIQRVDGGANGSGWGQALFLDWFAVQ